MKNSLPLFFFCLISLPLFSQNAAPDSLPAVTLPAVTINAYRIGQPENETPLAFSQIGSERLQHGQQQLALNESLAALPGVFVQNGDNFAQDVRVSIRGYGARAAFGIRGIRILQDGFPESSPDGQGQVDNVEPGMLHGIHVTRGSLSGLYGNASGGVLHFTSLNFSENEYVEGSVSGGSFGFQKLQLKAGGSRQFPAHDFNRGAARRHQIAWQIGGSRTRSEGYRQQSEMKNSLLNGGLRWRPDSASQIIFAINYANSPQADDAGAVTLELAKTDPRLARDRNVTFDAGETVEQGRVGLSFSKKFKNEAELTVKTWLARRSFGNKLPFEAGGIVDLKRNFGGANLTFSLHEKLFSLPWQIQFGVEAERQSDERFRFDNLEGRQGAVALHQIENAQTLGGFFIQKISLTKHLHLLPALRFDRVKLSADDYFISNGDDSGERNFSGISPMLGVSFSKSGRANIFFNAGSNFETPTLSELSANPGGAGGFNRDLQQQKSLSLELGARGWLLPAQFRYEASVFHIRLKDEFVPYELPQFPGRIFYRNAGESSRNGIELGLGATLPGSIHAYLNYTYSDFQFTDYQLDSLDFAGNRQPGAPRHLAWLELRYQPSEGFFGVLTHQMTGSQFADDANTVEVEASHLTNMRLGWFFQFEGWSLEPSLGVNNLFYTDYFSNVRLNAAAQRYYESGAGRHIFAGLKFRI